MKIYIFIICCFCFGKVFAQDGFMLAADDINKKIHKIDLTSGHVSTLNIPGLSSPTGVLYDHDKGHVFVADFENRTIQRCMLTGSGCSTYQAGIGYPDRIAIDYSTGNVYYTADASIFANQRHGYIGVISPSHNAHGYLLSGLRKPRGIALYPSKGLMFWTDHSFPNDHIGRASMDGSDGKVLVYDVTHWPNGITVDYASDRIYWTDGYFDRITSCDIDGKNRLVHLVDPGAHIMDIVIKGSYLYYSAWNRSVITKVDMSTYTISPWMSSAPEFGRIDGIDIYPADAQPISRMCSNNNGGCNTFCIPTTSTTVVCKCDESLTGSVNTKTCQTEDPSTITYCNATILNGILANGCPRKPGSPCDYKCNKGYKKMKEVMIICLVNGQWSENVASLCQEFQITTTPSPGSSTPTLMRSTSGSTATTLMRSTSGSTATTLMRSTSGSSAIVAAGIVASIGTILIVVAIVIGIFVFRKGFLRKLRRGGQNQGNRTTTCTDSGPPSVYYIPDERPPLYEQIDSQSQHQTPAYQNLEKRIKSQGGTTDNFYESLHNTAEANPYAELPHHP